MISILLFYWIGRQLNAPEWYWACLVIGALLKIVELFLRAYKLGADMHG